MKKITSLLGNSQKLDGGAMFGHVPKTLWSQWVAPDEQNRIALACRALLIEDNDKKILLETGIGAFFEPTLRQRYGIVEPEHVLLESLKTLGLTHHDIDVVILSHLHFDHAGGLLSAWKENATPELLFPNATYVVSKSGWDRACNTHFRDRASFVPTLNQLLATSGRLYFIENETCDLLGPHYQFVLTQGHTPGLLHTIIHLPNDNPIIFASDLIPGRHWVHLPVGMGYDRAPELLIDEKKSLLELAIKLNARLFYTHDEHVAMSSIREEKGKFMAFNEVKEFVRI